MCRAAAALYDDMGRKVRPPSAGRELRLGHPSAEHARASEAPRKSQADGMPAEHTTAQSGLCERTNRAHGAGGAMGDAQACQRKGAGVPAGVNSVRRHGGVHARAPVASHTP